MAAVTVSVIVVPEVTPVGTMLAAVSVTPQAKVSVAPAPVETLHFKAKVLIVPFGITKALSKVNVYSLGEVVSSVEGFTTEEAFRAVSPS